MTATFGKRDTEDTKPVGFAVASLLFSFLLQNFRFLDLLQVLCVCDGVAIPNNQTYIVKHWLKSYKVRYFRFDD